VSRSVTALWLRSDAGATVLALALAGVGAVLTLASLGTGEQPLLVAGGAAVLSAMVVVILTGFTDGLVLLVLALPLPALYRSEEIRLAPAAPVAAALLLGWALRLGLGRTRLDLGRLPRKTFLAWLLATSLAVVASPYVLTALREWLNLAVLLGLLALATALLREEPRRRGPLIEALVMAAALCGILAVLEALGAIPGTFPRYGTGFYRAALGFGQPNALGEFLGITLPLAAHLAGVARTEAARALRWSATVLIGVGVLATFSRGTAVSVLLGLGGTALGGGGRWTGRMLLGSLGLLLAVDLVSGGIIRDTVQRTLGDAILEQRAGLLWSGVLMFLDRPLLGFGPGGFAEALADYGPQITWLYDYLPTPHNAFVQMAAETGVVGLLAFSSFLAAGLTVAFRSARRAARNPDLAPVEKSLRRALLWSLLAAGSFCLVEWPFAHGTGEAVMLVAALTFATAGPPPVGTRATGGATG